MFSRLVTCSKKTPSELRAGEAATRSSRPSRNAEIVADRPSPRPSIVTTAHGVEPRGPCGGRGVRLVVIDEAQRRARQSVRARAARRSARPAERRRDAGRAPLGHAVLERRGSAARAARVAPCGGARRSSVPCCPATRGRASWPDRSSRRRRRRTSRGRETGRAPDRRRSTRDGKRDLELAARQPFFVDGRTAAGRPAAARRRNRGRPRCRECSRSARDGAARQKNRYLTSE